MSSKRPPFWLTAADFDDLDKLIMQRLETGDHGLARAIHEELSVAKTRFSNGLYRDQLLTVVLGLERDSIPIRLSNEERAYLLDLPLSKSLREGFSRA